MQYAYSKRLKILILGLIENVKTNGNIEILPFTYLKLSKKGLKIENLKNIKVADIMGVGKERGRGLELEFH